jgi:hypothetical protein
MFTAWGAGAIKNRDNTITVKVKITDDTQHFVAAADYTARDLDAVKALIQADLEARVDAVTDEALQAAVVGKELGSV